MAAPSFAASGTAFSGGGSGVDVAAPAGVVANSVIIVDFFLNGTPDLNVVAPGDWSAAEGSPVVVSGHRLYVFWHRASGIEAGPYSFTWDVSEFREGQAHRYEGVVTSGNPFDAGANTAVDNGNGSSTPAVSVTTLGTERLLVHAATCWAGGTWTPPTGFTKRQQPSVGLSTLSDLAQAAAGSSGAVVATTTTSDKRGAWLGALKPVVGSVITGTGDASLPGPAAVGVGLRTTFGVGSAALGPLLASGVVESLPSLRHFASGREPRSRVAGREPRRLLL